MDLEDFHLIHLLYDKGHQCEFDPNICNLSDDWKNPPTPGLLEKTVYTYLNYAVKEVGQDFQSRLNQLVASNVRDLEHILHIGNNNIQRYIINAFSSNQSTKLSEQSIYEIESYFKNKYIEMQCLRNLCTTSTEVLTNYLTHFSTNITHADFVVDLLNKEDFDKDARIRAIKQFIDSVQDHKPVDNRVFDKYASLLDSDDTSYSLLQAFGNACVNGSISLTNSKS